MASGKILLVDDDLGIRETYRQILELEGFPTDTAEDGMIALHYLQQHQAPDLILLDLMMPRMDGQEFLAIKNKDPKLATIPVVMMSAHAPRELKDFGQTPLLRKPVSLDVLLDTVKGYVT